MTHGIDSKAELGVPAQPLPAGAEDFSRKVSGLLDGREKDEATVEKALAGFENVFEQMAAGLYSLASMLVGEGEASVGLVETAVSTVELAKGADAQTARQNCRSALSRAAIALLEKREPGCLAAPEDVRPAGGCIEDDDLEAAGVSSEELESMMAGPERERVRAWLESLPTAQRVIFVLRAVAGFKSDEAAALLAERGGTVAAGWSAKAVRELFRQALCSLASQLIHATTR
ncbi:MAG TPA: sigma factor-like helix-turn-helix DNA-binding protein [Terracidiphilus sp.]|nr:sigma factor-like helix-turn-helix DNA-binding protein [Terracidiphilus sp.]